MIFLWFPLQRSDSVLHGDLPALFCSICDEQLPTAHALRVVFFAALEQAGSSSELL